MPTNRRLGKKTNQLPRQHPPDTLTLLTISNPKPKEVKITMHIKLLLQRPFYLYTSMLLRSESQANTLLVNDIIAFKTGRVDFELIWRIQGVLNTQPLKFI